MFSAVATSNVRPRVNPDRRLCLTRVLLALKTLEILEMYEIASPDVPQLSFHLTTLRLSYTRELSSFKLLDALSRQSSITSLDISGIPFHSPRILESLGALAPQLHTLNIGYKDESRSEFLKCCTHLHHLESAPVTDFVSQFPTSLVSWTLRGFERYHLNNLLVEVRDSNPIVIARLERIVLELSSGNHPRGLRGVPGWPELEKWCREKKDELVVLVDGGM